MSDNLARVEAGSDSITIKIPKEKLSDFLGDFLKTKRQIGRKYSVVFDINKEDVINMISVIDHRISEQNESVRTDFYIDVLFDDGSNRTYPSLEFFKKLDDNLSAVSVAVFIKLTYLIRFPDDESPTKQEVSILASSRDMGTSWSSSPSFQEANLIINISTNRFTWAEDVINHFSNYVKGKFSEIGKFTKFFMYVTQSRHMISLSAILIMLLVMVFVFSSANESVYRFKEGFSSYDKLVGGKTLDSANEKLDVLLSMSLYRYSIFSFESVFPYAVYFVAAIFVFFIFPVFYCFLSDASYVSIGRNSVEKNNMKKNRKNRLRAVLFGGVCLSVFCSLFANYLWVFISKYV